MTKEFKIRITRLIEARRKSNSTQPLGERLIRMEELHNGALPFSLEFEVLSRIISLRIKKIKQDHCEYET